MLELKIAEPEMMGGERNTSLGASGWVIDLKISLVTSDSSRS